MGRPKKNPDPPNPYHYLPEGVGFTRTQLEAYLDAGPEPLLAESAPRTFEWALIAHLVCKRHGVEPPNWAQQQIDAAHLALLEGIDPRACLPLPWFESKPKEKPPTRAELKALLMADEVKAVLAERRHLLKRRVYEIVGETFGASPQHVQRAYLEHYGPPKPKRSKQRASQNVSKKT